MKGIGKISAAVLAICLIFTSCDWVFAANTVSSVISSDSSREVRDLKGFTQIRNSSPIDVIYTQSDEYSVVLEGDSKYFEKVLTNVSDGELIIKLEKGNYINMHMRVLVSSPMVTALSMNGSGDLKCASDITTDQPLVMRVSGSGDFSAPNVECSKADVSVSGSGDIAIARLNSASADISISGSGDVEVRKLESVTANLTVRGSGDMSVGNAVILGGMSAKVQGSGDIQINGQAKEISASTMGSGDIYGEMKYEKLTKNRAGSGSVRL